MAETESPKTTQEVITDNVNRDKIKNFAQTKATTGTPIYLGSNGLLGIGLIVAMALICFVYFGLILNVGDFNDKWSKEKMPLGKEY